MNFYASNDYLEAAASVYFKNRRTAIEEVRIGDDVLRLLVVDGRKIVTEMQFLDLHHPVTPSNAETPVRKGGYAENVVRGVIEATAWDPSEFEHFKLAPYIDWRQFDSFEAYRAQILARNKGLIRDQERRRRSLVAAHGELVFTMNDLRDDVLPLARQWKSQQLRQTGLLDYFDKPETHEFLTTLRERNLLVSSTLRVADRLISVWIGFVHDGSWSGWIFTYDPAFRKYSAGHQLLSSMLEESYRLGHHEFDFSIGSEDYKMMYATHGRLLGSIGRQPLAQALAGLAKRELLQRTPRFFHAAKRLKKAVRQSLASRPQASHLASSQLHPASHSGTPR